jgi:insulysin
LLAQNTATSIIENASPEDKSAILVASLGKIFAAHNITSEPEKLATHLRGRRLSLSDPAPVAEAVTAYLTKDANVPVEEAQEVVQQGLLALGGSTEQVEESGKGEKKAGSAREAVLIEDVHAWKASLIVDAGAQPVRPLSDFEDIEAKL